MTHQIADIDHSSSGNDRDLYTYFFAVPSHFGDYAIKSIIKLYKRVAKKMGCRPVAVTENLQGQMVMIGFEFDKPVLTRFARAVEAEHKRLDRL